MPKSLQQVADEIYQIVGPLPIGFSIEVDEKTDNILVKSPELGFAISNHWIRDHVENLQAVKPSFDGLKKAVAQYYAVRAAELDQGSANMVIESIGTMNYVRLKRSLLSSVIGEGE